MKKLMKNKSFRAGLVITGVMVFLAIAGPFITPWDPEEMNRGLKFSGVSLSHIMGCDNFGRDIFSRVLYGLRTTMIVAVGTVFIGCAGGVIIGSLTGYFGGIFDTVVMRINDVLFAFPAVLIALVFVSLFGSSDVILIVALGVAFIPSFARMVRSEFLRNRSLDYVAAARLQGAGNFRIIFFHILPNAWPVLLQSVIIGFNNAVLAEAGMSFLGIGVQPPAASLGRMLSEAQSYIRVAPGYALFPGLVIILMVLGLGLMSRASYE
ncbi:MAG: ABC transporter permease [Lachnospiraceae bacterium]|nr:ABC transporter permease [Lachnospiraceae bacterium]